MDKITFNEILNNIQRPSRYIGREINSVYKNLEDISLRFVLAFPDIYDIGMSHLGLQILYNILNKHPKIWAERVYAPWHDFEIQLRSKGLTLFSLESRTPIKDFDAIGITLPYELSYTTVINILNLGGIPLLSRDRDDNYPIILGGGACSLNPEPIAEIFDAILIGDGEEGIIEISNLLLEWKRSNSSKDELLKALLRIEGVYVPKFFNIKYQNDGTIEKIYPLLIDYQGVKRKIVKDLNNAVYPENPIVPYTQIVHDRISLEIARGCTKGCRFCQAGMIYRPTRERNPKLLAKIVESAYKTTGYEEISLLSLSTGDYTCLKPLVNSLIGNFLNKKVAISLPSLRIGSIDRHVMEEIKRIRKTGFTFAPECGTQRLRDFINKDITEDETIKTAIEVFNSGWQGLKLYFMIGLPTETEDDVNGIIDLSKKVLKASYKAKGTIPNINISISTFVPKPNTPFQWESQIGLEESESKLKHIKAKLKDRGLKLKWHAPKLSFLEGVLSRGDRRLLSVLLKVYEKGSRLDTWREHFIYENWISAFEDCGIDPNWYISRERKEDEVLPWYHLDSLVTKKFLWGEKVNAFNVKNTSDCFKAKCVSCGVCDFKEIDLRPANSDNFNIDIDCPKNSFSKTWITKLRIKFTKTDEVRFLSHLETMNCLIRALRRAGIPLVYTSGFHPLPKIGFGPALSVGIESHAEYMDIEIEGSVDSEEFLNRVNNTLPKGIKFIDCQEIPLKSKAISNIIEYVKYEITVNQLMSKSNKNINDIKEITRNLENVNITDDVLNITLKYGSNGNIKPREVISKIFGFNEEEIRQFKIIKRETVLNSE